MKTIKVTDTSNTQLDWLVAKCEGAVNPPKETTWEDVKDLTVPFQMWEVSFNDKGQRWISPITVTRCGVDESVGATAPSISAIDHKGRAFRGSIGDYYLTALEAEKEMRVQTCGDLSNPASYSTDWALGGPIIEREKIAILPDEASRDWLAEIPFTLRRDDEYWCGPTPLIAAARCYVTSKLGEIVEVPEELE